MSEKYTDLIHAIESSDSMTGCERVTVEAVLAWLDFHPDQVPGRTITTTQLRAGMKAEGIAEGEEFEQFWTGTLGNFGITVVPDPEPTNAEKLAELIREIGYDIRHNGRLSGSNALALDLDARGVKAPGGDDER